MYLQLSKSQPLIGVVGLPRSGTTILANLLDSCDNGFCVVEPIWAAECGVQAKEYSTTKTGTFSTAVSSEVPNKLRDVVKEKNFGFGAIKETYRDHQLFCTQPVIENCDILLASIRDPLDTFASWKRTGWGSPYDSVSFFVKNYINFHSKMQQLSQVKPVINIVHEDLCKEKLTYFNNKFASEGQIVGDFKLSGVESPYSMGDGRACSSKDFEQNLKNSTVSVSEMKIVQKRLRAFYMSLKLLLLFVCGLFAFRFFTPHRVKTFASDLNRDGKIDIVSIENKTVSVFLNTGQSFTKSSEFKLTTEPRLIELADFDGDGKADLLLIGDHTLIMRGNGDGTFSKETAFEGN